MLEDLLKQNKVTLAEEWRRLIMETYPPDTTTFLDGEKNRFANPVGYTISKETDILFEELLSDMDYEKLTESLGNIIRIRAVQDFSPSRLNC